MKCLIDTQNVIPAIGLLIPVALVFFVLGIFYTRWAVKKNPGQLGLTTRPRYK